VEGVAKDANVRPPEERIHLGGFDKLTFWRTKSANPERRKGVQDE